MFQVIATTLVEVDDKSKVEQILGSAYRVTIDQNRIDSFYQTFKEGFPLDYPNNIKRLIRQSIINLDYGIESDDYSQYAFPALRALEGHIKYLIVKAGGSVGRSFSGFDKDNYGYYYVGQLTNTSKKAAIEECYNYYKAQRDTLFHFGDVLGGTDSTRVISKKEDADEIISKCLSLINEQV